MSKLHPQPNVQRQNSVFRS